MFSGKKGPIILIFVLVICLFFILGMQYGKMVEKTDKSIKAFLSATPTKAITLSEQPKTTYDMYTFNECGISLIRPSSLINKQESSDSAKLSSADFTEFIEIYCSNSPITNISLTPTPISLDSNSATVYETDSNLEYRTKHPTNGKQIIIKVDKNIAPIVQNTIQFEN